MRDGIRSDEQKSIERELLRLCEENGNEPAQNFRAACNVVKGIHPKVFEGHKAAIIEAVEKGTVQAAQTGGLGGNVFVTLEKFQDENKDLKGKIKVLDAAHESLKGQMATLQQAHDGVLTANKDLHAAAATHEGERKEWLARDATNAAKIKELNAALLGDGPPAGEDPKSKAKK